MVTAQDKEDLSYMMRKPKEYEKGGLEINCDKTDYLEKNSNLNGNLKILDCRKR